VPATVTDVARRVSLQGVLFTWSMSAKLARLGSAAACYRCEVLNSGSLITPGAPKKVTGETIELSRARLVARERWIGYRGQI
jgi:hypothetical protein